jgi:hypothetical protein
MPGLISIASINFFQNAHSSSVCTGGCANCHESCSSISRFTFSVACAAAPGISDSRETKKNSQSALPARWPTRGALIFITGRNVDRARTLSRFAGGEALSREQAEASHLDALVHATPLGTDPNVNSCFFEDAIPADVVFDMVYNPLETLLIRRAKEQGKQVIPGLKMFIERAVAQFELYRRRCPPRAMEKAALDVLEQQRIKH